MIKYCDKCNKKLTRAYKYFGKYLCHHHWTKFRHCDGYHTKGCGVYSNSWCGIVCKFTLDGIMGKPYFFQKDRDKLRQNANAKMPVM